MQCLGQTNNGDWCQESYETASRFAARRARQLRKLGYDVASESLGPQITHWGLVRVTLLTIRPGSNPDTYGLPAVQRL